MPMLIAARAALCQERIAEVGLDSNKRCQTSFSTGPLRQSQVAWRSFGHEAGFEKCSAPWFKQSTESPPLCCGACGSKKCTQLDVSINA